MDKMLFDLVSNPNVNDNTIKELVVSLPDFREVVNGKVPVDNFFTGIPWLACLRKRKNLELIELFVEHGADVNLIDPCGENAFNIACQYQEVEVIEFLNTKCAEIHAKNADDIGAIHHAALNEKPDVLKFLVEVLPFDVNTVGKNGETPFRLAALYGRFKNIEYLLKNGAKIAGPLSNGKDKDGQTLLIYASKRGYVDIVKLLLESGVGDYTADENWWTALTHACVKGREEVVNLLLDSKMSEINVIDDNGFSVLMRAIAAMGISEDKERHGRVIKRLLEEGVNVDIVDNYGGSALIYAAKGGHEWLVKSLLKSGAKVNQRDGKGYTPLLYACRKGCGEIVKSLIAAGADVNDIAEEYGNTGLSLAIGANCPSIVEILLEAGADVNIPNRDGMTPLIKASEYGQRAIVAQLVVHGAKIDIVDKYGKDALTYARKGGHKEIAETLTILLRK